MAIKISETVKFDFMETVKEFLESKGEEVLLVKSGTFSIPWVKGDDEGYLNLTFSIPKGSRDGSGYDGHEEAENFAFETAEKAKKKAENEAKKKRKIEKDSKEREKGE